MADRYLVASGTWNSSNTSIWSATSGGASGASAPTSSDIVYVGGGFTVTIASGAVCNSLIQTTLCTITGTAGITIHGGLTLYNPAPPYWAYTGDITFGGTSISSTTLSAPVSMTNNIIVDRAGGEIRITNMTTTGSITLTRGGLVIYGNVSCSTMNISGSNTRTMNISGGTVSCTNWTATTTTSLTMPQTGNIMVTNGTFAGGGSSYFNVTLVGSVTIVGSNTFGSVSLYTPATLLLTSGTTQTITSTLYSVGSTGNINILCSTSAGNLATITSPGDVDMVSFTNIKDITAAGDNTWTASNCIDSGGNTGWTFSGVAPSYNPSIITAVARPQQGLAVPRFVIGGKGGPGATTYGIYKQGTTYGLNLWRSKPIVFQQPFTLTWIRLRLSVPVTTGVLIIPSLRFDGGRAVVYGTEIKPPNYPNNNMVITMTKDNFDGDVTGSKNVSLELNFQGSTLCSVELPITMLFETLETQLSN